MNKTLLILVLVFNVYPLLHKIRILALVLYIHSVNCVSVLYGPEYG